MEPLARVDAYARRGTGTVVPSLPVAFRCGLSGGRDDHSFIARGRFGLMEAVPKPGPLADRPAEPTVADEPPAMSKRRFWRRFVQAVHALLAKEGSLTAEEILERIDPEWIGASERFQRITPGRLRYKLRGRIDEGRPFEELPGERFAAVSGEEPWDGESAMSGAVRNG
ncbi:hypothetical protein [Methylobacterium persicinum]|uniref:Uncharacterized protein n=1 Tax=Methylobacterium persicinum TaxID=374426 RepID=A0ABU0HJ46_9HYPH|nr:hypothetical protein [Methylobacterium persicinum]MDQ0441853.1 hypothetical protein [Methylobacterium persicinum]GJE38035.1 hypothetical protein KHHGKMAE_2101 [Methylobacterium persicinum]